MKTPGLMIGSIVTGLVAVVGLVAVQRKDAAAENITQYTSALVTRGDINRTVNAVGQLRPVSVPVSSQISGLVTAVHVDFNSVVKRGDVLANIDPSTFQQNLRRAQADLEAAEADHRLRMLKNERYSEMRSKDVVAQQLYDEVAASLQQSKSILVTLSAAVENALVDLKRCTITSPIDGVVIYKGVEIGETIVSSTTAPTLFAVSEDPKKMNISVLLQEDNVSLVSLGQAVTFTLEAVPQRRFEGRVTQIRNPYTPPEKQQAPQQGTPSSIPTFETVIEVDNADMTLRPGYTATVSIVVDRREDVLVVPNGAFRVDPPNGAQDANSKETLIAYRVKSEEDRAPEPVPVRIGISDDTHTEILGGLAKGDRIVTGTIKTQEVQQQSLF